MAEGFNVSDFLNAVNKSGFSAKSSSASSFDGELVVETNAAKASKDMEKFLKTLNDTTQAAKKLKEGLEDIDEIGGDKLLKRQKDILGYMKQQLKVDQDLLKTKKNQEILTKRITALQDTLSDSISDVAKLNDRLNKLKAEGLELDKDMLKLNESGAEAEAARKKYLTQVLVIQKQNLQVQQVSEKSLKNSVTTAGKFKNAINGAKQGMKDFARSIPTKAVNALGSKLAQIGSWGMVLHDFVDAGTALTDMSYSLSLMPGHISNTKEQADRLNKSLNSVRETAAKYNVDMDEAKRSAMELARRVRFMKPSEGGKMEVDDTRLAEDTSRLIKFSKLNNVDMSTAIGMYKTNIEKFGMSKDDALKAMESITDRTLFFNEVLGEAGFHAEDVAQHLASVQQNTRYWVQDMGMLNTMFGNHIALLAKQGKSQEHALALASKFNEAVNEPPPLVKWTAGNKMLKELRTEMAKARAEAKEKGKDVTQAEQAIVRKKFLGSLAGVTEVDGKLMNGTVELSEDQARQYRARANQADTFYKAMQGGNTGFTLANMLQEMGGGMGFGLKGTIEGWKRYTHMDSTVLAQSLGLGNNAAEAEELKQLINSINAGSYSDDDFSSKENLLKVRARNEGLFTEEQMETSVDAQGNVVYKDAAFKAYLEEQSKLLDVLSNNKADSIEQNLQAEVWNGLKDWLAKPEVHLLGAVGSTALDLGGAVLGSAISGAIGSFWMGRKIAKLAPGAGEAGKVGKAIEEAAKSAEKAVDVAAEGAKTAEKAADAVPEILKGSIVDEVAKATGSETASVIEEVSKAAETAGKDSRIGLNVAEELARVNGGASAVEAVAETAGKSGTAAETMAKAAKAASKATKGSGKKALIAGGATFLGAMILGSSEANASEAPAGEAVSVVPVEPAAAPSAIENATQESVVREAERIIAENPELLNGIADDVHTILEIEASRSTGSSMDLSAIISRSRKPSTPETFSLAPNEAKTFDNIVLPPPEQPDGVDAFAEKIENVTDAVEVAFGAVEAVNLVNTANNLKGLTALETIAEVGSKGAGKLLPGVTGAAAVLKTGVNLYNGDYKEAAKSAGAGVIDTAMMTNPVTAGADFLFSGVTTLTKVVGDAVGFEAKSMSIGEFATEALDILSNIDLLFGAKTEGQKKAEEALLEAQIRSEDVLSEKADKDEQTAYKQLDAFSKLLKNSEETLKLHEKWYQLDVEGQVRDIMMNDDLSEKEKKKLLNGMAGGVAGSRDVRLAMDVSGKATVLGLDRLVAAYGGT